MATGYFGLIAEQLGVSVFLLLVIIVWSQVWKLLALWKAGRKNHLVWFIVLALVNTIGILDILYIFVFSEMKRNNFRNKKQQKAARRRRR